MATRIPTPTNDGLKAPNYTGYSQSHGYTYDPGLLVMPLADGGHVVVRVHQGVGFRQVGWDATKRDTPPVVPTAGDVVDTNGATTATLLGAAVTAPLPAVNPAGNGYDWSVSGVYTYVLTNPLTFDGSEGIPTGDYPFTTNYLQLGIGSLAGGLGFATFPTTNPDAITIQFDTQYTYPYQFKLGKQFFSDDLIR